jgi:hypothetical protein
VTVLDHMDRRKLARNSCVPGSNFRSWHIAVADELDEGEFPARIAIVSEVNRAARGAALPSQYNPLCYSL